MRLRSIDKFDVHDQPVLIEAQIFEPNIHRLASATGRAVAGHQVIRAQHASVVEPNFHAGSICVMFDYLPPEHQLRPAIACLVAKHCIEHRLKVLAHHGAAQHFNALQVDSRQLLARSIDKICRQHRFKDFFQLRRKPEPSEAVTNLGVHDDGARQAIHIDASLNDGVRYPDGAERDGCHETNRATADNDYMHWYCRNYSFWGMDQSRGIFRFANVKGRASLVIEEQADGGGTAIDIERATNGTFSHHPMSVFPRWNELKEIAPSLPTTALETFGADDLRAPSPEPRQIFGIGLNYRAHAVETGVPLPDSPLTFTKFASSIHSPNGDIRIDVATADWEIEVVAVVGSGGRNIPQTTAWNAIAGICVGQDISDRKLQRATQPPQFSLGKSRAGYSPIGPWLVDASSLTQRDALALTCTLNGDVVQQSNSNDLIFNIPQLVAYLSSIVELYPGDVIFTGTPSGVGAARKPPIPVAG